MARIEAACRNTTTKMIVPFVTSLARERTLVQLCATGQRGIRVAKLVIQDLAEGFLRVDLRDLLRALAPQSLAALWTVSSSDESDFEAIGSGGVRLEELASLAATIEGSELLAVADDTVQVIWGNFQGKLPESPYESWINIRVFDSSFFEVETSDESAIARLVSRFRNVRFEAC